MPAVRDFDLIIDRSETAYHVRVNSNLAGSLSARPLELPLGIERLPRRRLDVFEWIRELQNPPYLSGGEPKELRQARDFGSALFRAVFRDEVLASFRASRLGLAPGERLRLRLRLPDTLTAVPWELLYDADPAHEEWLALAPDVILVRHPEIPVPITPLQLHGPLQVVIVLAAPEGYPPINTERELRRVTNALQTAEQSGQVALTIISGNNTYGKLSSRLREPVHILHIFCHGDIDLQTQEGVLIFEDEQGDPWEIRAGTLRVLLGQQRGYTQLVLLNACLGASTSSKDPFSSVGAALVRAGVSAVIAMQFAVREDVAADLTRAIYQALAVGIPLDRALWEARVLIFEQYRNRLDWAIPVLFLQGGEGRLFIPTPGRQTPQNPDVPPSSSLPSISEKSDESQSSIVELAPRNPVINTPAHPDESTQSAISNPAPTQQAPSTSRVTRLMLRARTALSLGDYVRATAELREIEKIAPHLEGLALLKEVSKTYLDIDRLRTSDDWQETLDLILRLDSLLPGFADPKEHRTWVQIMQSQFESYDLALAAFEKGQWDNAVEALVEYHQKFLATQDSMALQEQALQRSEKWRKWKEEQNNKIHMLTLLGQLDEAERLRQELDRSFPKSTLWEPLEEDDYKELDALSEVLRDNGDSSLTPRNERRVPRRSRYSEKYLESDSVGTQPRQWRNSLTGMARVIQDILRGWRLFMFLIVLVIAIAYMVWR